MTGKFRVAVDSLVAKASPELVVPTGTKISDFELTVFDTFASPGTIAGHLAEIEPDVIVVDPAWLVAAAWLESLTTISGVGKARRVIGAVSIGDVLKIQTAHRGFTWQLDLTQPSDLIVRQLCELSVDAPRQDILLWNSIPLPAMVSSISETARDLIDQEILDLVSVGMQDADIASVVHASTQTVKNRISGMLERSGFRNRTQLEWMHSNDAVAEAMVRGLRQRA